MSLFVSVLRTGRQIVMPALSAQRGRFLGVPFNIASYSLLTLMIAQVCGLQPGTFIHTFGDVHLYLNHLQQAELQLSRTPLNLPEMKINPLRRNIDEFCFEDFELIDYQAHPAIKAPIAV